MKPNCVVRVVSLLMLASAALTAQVARQESVVPLKNWATPLYWQPSQAERGVFGKATPQLQLSANALSTSPLTFVAITPCRLVDTRGVAAGFNGIAPFSGPSIAAAGTLTIPVQSTTEAGINTEPAPCGAIPSIAQAYSFNLTVVPRAGGAVDYVSLWPAGSAQPFVATLNDPQGLIAANAVIVPAGTPSGGISVFNAGPATTDAIIDMNGYFAAPTDVDENTAIGAGSLASNTTGSGNTASGANALLSNTTGNGNTATGADTLALNTIGGANTASGAGALFNNTTGSNNTATGVSALNNSTTGSFNTADGVNALAGNSTGDNNTASGFDALTSNTTGAGNTAIGSSALKFNTSGGSNTANGGAALEFNSTGSNNIAIGSNAATNVSSSNSNNIHIGSVGAFGDNATIQIGTQGIQTTTFIAGISGGSPGAPNFLVCVDGNGLLGTSGCGSTPSSLRFKDQIADMGDSSNKLFQLRPVTFLYKPQYDDGSHTLQYGLIAEEVAKLYPEMVGYDKDGQPSSVKYQSLAPMLLNEVQKQNAQLQDLGRLRNLVQLQQEENRKLEDRLAALEALLSDQTAAK